MEAMPVTDTLELTPYYTTEELAEAVERDGFAYMPSVLDADEVSELRDHIAALEPNPEAFDRRTDIDKHIKTAFNRDPYFVRFLDMEPSASLAERLMGEDCHVIGMSAWTTGPNRPDQNLHVDYLPLEISEDLLINGTVKMPVFIATAHYYLDDLYEDLGPTKFIPGSHFAGRKPTPEDRTWRGAKEKSLMCKAGDCVLFRSEVWHRGSANTSGQTRYLLQVHYAQRMITQKFPPYLRFRFDEAILAIANQRQRRFLGDHKHANYD